MLALRPVPGTELVSTTDLLLVLQQLLVVVLLQLVLVEELVLVLVEVTLKALARCTSPRTAAACDQSDTPAVRPRLQPLAQQLADVSLR